MSKDFVFCFDAADGKTIWKKELPSWHLGWSDACSPTIADGKCYVLSSEAFVYCLDAKTGDEVWKSEFVGREGNKHNRSSSLLILDGAALGVTVQNAFALDAKTGKTLWQQNQASGEYGSPVPWTSGDKTVAIVLTKRNAYALDPKTGDVLWRVGGSEGATANIAGDLMVTNGGQYGGVSLYRLSLDTPRRMWNVKFIDLFTTPTILDGRVYIFGGAFRKKNPSRAMCIEMSSGKVLWDREVGTFEFSSGVLADGKILINGGSTFYLLKPDPQKYVELGKADLGLQPFSTPTLVDGRLYVRTKERVECYDLRK
jgi:outer membrane protein assembly factor BamB